MNNYGQKITAEALLWIWFTLQIKTPKLTCQHCLESVGSGEHCSPLWSKPAHTLLCWLNLLTETGAMTPMETPICDTSPQVFHLAVGSLPGGWRKDLWDCHHWVPCQGMKCVHSLHPMGGDLTSELCTGHSYYREQRHWTLIFPGQMPIGLGLQDSIRIKLGPKYRWERKKKQDFAGGDHQ